MENDFIFVNDFELPCRIGTTAEERGFPQILFVSLKIELPLSKAGRTDDLNDTADYAAFIESVREIARSKEFNLVECLAETIARNILTHPLVAAINVTISKKAFAGVGAVGASLHRVKSKRA